MLNLLRGHLADVDVEEQVANPHCPQGCNLLCHMLRRASQEGMLDPLIDVAPKAALITTRVPDAAAASMDPEKVARAWGAGAAHIADADRAFGSALERASQTTGTLVVCGSLYLVGYVRAKLMALGAIA